MRRLLNLAIALACLLPPSQVLALEAFVILDRQAARALVDPTAHALPTIVALWSSDCPHCKKNLELFAKMFRNGHRFNLITIATEQPFSGLARPLDRLAVPGKRFAYGGESREALAFSIDPQWRGELPRTLFFDGRGGKVAISGVVDEAATMHSLGLVPKR